MAAAVQTQETLRTGYRKKTEIEKIAERNKRAAKIIICVGLLLLAVVAMAAYAADLQQENNKLESDNKLIQAEIDSLNKQINDATNIETVRRIATKKLGMVQPDESNYITIKDSKTKDYNLASTIKKEAYD